MSGEDNLWAWLRDCVLPLGKYSRIESPDTAPGYPDVDGLTVVAQRPFAFKFELKYSHRPHCPKGKSPFPSEDSGLHKSQRKWLRDSRKYTHNVWIVAEVNDKIFISNAVFGDKFNNSTAEQLADYAELILPRYETAEAAKRLLSFFEFKAWQP